VSGNQHDGFDVAQMLVSASAVDFDDQQPESLETLSTAVLAQLDETMTTEAGTQS
jgi:hypothetical protein